MTDPLIPTMTDSEIAAWELMAKTGVLRACVNLPHRIWLVALAIVMDGLNV